MVVAALVALAAAPSSAGPMKPTKLVFVQQPVGDLTGQVLTPAVTVQGTDNRGRPVPGPYSIAVSLNNAGGAVLQGTKTRTANASGIATFDDLAVTQAGTYTLRAATGKIFTTSAAFTTVGDALDCSNPSVDCTLTVGNIADPPSGDVAWQVSSDKGACVATSCNLSAVEEECTTASCHGVLHFTWASNATGIGVILITCDKDECTGTGVANFDVTMDLLDGQGPRPVGECANPAPTLEEIPIEGCIHARSRTGVGDLQIEIWKNASGDPRTGI